MSDEEPKLLSVAGHPRAAASIARVRSLSAIGAVILVIVLGWGTGMSGSATSARAVLAGLIGYMVGWAAAVGVWREIVRAEFLARARRRYEGRTGS